MIVNDDSSIVSEQSFQLIDYARGIIYDQHMFIIQATDFKFEQFSFSSTDYKTRFVEAKQRGLNKLASTSKDIGFP